MSWLWRLIFFGRIRRLKRIQKAAAMVAAGRIEEAEHILSTSKPKVWVDDLAVYHFVRGKLLMEQGALDEAEILLHAAIALGLDRASVKLNQAVLLVRKCQLNAALALLGDVELSDDPAVLEQSRVMREVIDEARRGVQLTEIGKRAARFRKKHLKKVAPSPKATLPALAHALREAKLSGSDRDDACLLLGQVMTEARGGTWMVGLEPRDHRVLVSGLIYSPAQMIDALLAGDEEQLSLPPAVMVAPA